MTCRAASNVEVQDGSAIVTLTRGFVAKIDVADIPLIQGSSWKAQLGKYGHAYAVKNENGKPMLMHRLLMSAEKGTYVDHIDGDGLNNCRSNLRFATHTQNIANMVVNRRSKVGLKGVMKSAGRFMATIHSNNKSIYLGMYNTKEEASAAYMGAARILWGEFARAK